MNQSHLKLFKPSETLISPYYKNILDKNVLGTFAYHNDWTFIFENILMWKKLNNNKMATILDVGCGNSMFHKFLEDYFSHGIIGIDRSESNSSEYDGFSFLEFCN